jgi:hypothetical protein
MTRVQWDKIGERRYETGVDRGVLYLQNAQGVYNTGFAWNGLTAVNESPSGAEANAQYADNIKYLNLLSAEEFGGTIEAFTYPIQFEQCDGSAAPVPGVSMGQQNRKQFGFSYRTLVGNDLQGTDYGYKLHLVYGALAAPSEKARNTVNDSPEAVNFSWEFSTTPTEVGQVSGVNYKPTSHITIDSTVVPANKLTELEDLLYGTQGTDPKLPTPAEVYAIFAGSTVTVTPTAPTATAAGVITIPTVTGVRYRRADTGVVVTGTVTISGGVGSSLIIVAEPTSGYRFVDGEDDDWKFTKTA